MTAEVIKKTPLLSLSFHHSSKNVVNSQIRSLSETKTTRARAKDTSFQDFVGHLFTFRRMF